MTDDQDDEEVGIADPGEDPYAEDYVAQRTNAYAKLYALVKDTEDTEMRREGIAMLVAIRVSWKKYSRAEVSVIQGGR
jgi:hypothetical protein